MKLPYTPKELNESLDTLKRIPTLDVLFSEANDLDPKVEMDIFHALKYLNNHMGCLSRQSLWLNILDFFKENPDGYICVEKNLDTDDYRVVVIASPSGDEGDEDDDWGDNLAQVFNDNLYSYRSVMEDFCDGLMDKKVTLKNQHALCVELLGERFAGYVASHRQLKTLDHTLPESSPESSPISPRPRM